jgi:hypothetical protein
MLKTFSKIFTVTALMLLASASLHAGKVSAYFDTEYASASAVKSKLRKAGFQVLSSYSPARMKHVDVIAYTCKSLKTMAAKDKRGFAAIQRVMVDSKKKTVRITNPEYWLKAFLQDDYKAGSGKKAMAKLSKAFGKLKATKDALKEGDLDDYHFMFGMPYYKDMLELGKARSVKAENKLFEVRLANGSTLIGVAMPKATESFIEKIGTENAILLPYTILIEDGKAYALHAKYYLAISYPLLSMGQFMKISSTPGKIEDNLKKIVQ